MTDSFSRMGVLTDPYLTETQVRSLSHAVSEADVEIPLVVVNATDEPDYDPDLEAEAVNGGLGLGTARLFLDVLRRERAWGLVIAEKKLGELAGSDAAASRQIPVEDVECLSEAEFRYVAPHMDGNWSELPSETVEEVRESCDVVVRYGFGLLKGEVLDAPEYGVLSFHPADIRQYRGLGPPQAYLDGRQKMGVTLQRITEDIDGGELVAYAETDVSDCATLWEIYDRLDDLQVELLTEGIRNLRDPSMEITTPDSLGEYYSTTSRRTPSFAGRILLKNITGRLGLR
ncbi:methionyl-tRNA formyltransferase [Natronomonas halophila]|uniref:formyltransferase family protein n=1 Tax=Natronomonas halophila TaxID=2747817 RepID=UPI0015B67E15|nr:formyltransferase family protein [Natronomonas halophila]QLD87208.1 methionyl-tRNA formyltransferase [Natronomonas halophila]